MSSQDVEELRAGSRRAAQRWREITAHPPTFDATTLLAASFTAHPIVPALGVALADAGHRHHVELGEANQLFQLALQPESFGLQPRDQLVVLWRIEDVFERSMHDWSCGLDAAADQLIAHVDSLGRALGALASQHVGHLVISDAPTPIGFGFDHRDSAELGSLIDLQHRVNETFDTALAESSAGVTTIDRLRLSALQSAYGTLATFDRRNWMMYRQPFADWFSFVVGSEIGRIVAARTRVPPKVLVLDCDGTLWDGVAADDGISGLAAGDAFPGRAHQEFQRVAQRLRHRGVLLALSSKNEPDTVVQAFAEVDGMVLTDADVATRRVSWQPKPDEIVAIAAELNVGVDSLVFVDDSPFEIGAVSTQLPSVRCLQVPEDVEALPDLLAESGLFRHLHTTADDRKRTEMIQAETDRTRASTSMTNAEFLTSLELTVDMSLLSPTDQSSLGRVTQLINKTNQCNVTTIRRDIAELQELVNSPDCAVLAFSVSDRFGEYGLVGVVIGRSTNAPPDAWLIDSFLMSCRVLGRGVETAMLALSVELLRHRKPSQIIATFIPSGRNDRVAGLFSDHRFVTVGENTFELSPNIELAVPSHITVTRQVSAPN
jgi:FkbH-like protein